MNPTSMLLAAALMLGHLGEQDAEQRLVNALESVIREGKQVTRDFGGTASTKEMAEAVARQLRKTPAARL